MSTPLTHSSGGFELLPELRALWEDLNRHHARVAPGLADHFAAVSFERRISLLADRTLLRVDLLREPDGAPVAYAFSSVDAHGRGELESIYVRPERRGMGLGRQLAARQVAWLRDQGAYPVRVSVAVGNEAALPFYSALGFRPRATVLWLQD
jgi:GNAT superfamily N-acetyltransferase